MRISKVVGSLGLSGSPIGLGGCKSQKTTFDCCEYNVTIFDGQTKKDQIYQIDDKFVKIHHGRLDESNVDVLQKYQNMQIISDENWSLRTFLFQIKQKEEKIHLSTIKGCLVDAAYFATKARQSMGTDPFASAWLKCAAYFVCDALVLLNSQMRSPIHMLDFIRRSQKSQINELFSTVAEILGLERATPSLLERMVKSTVGFSDMIEMNKNSLLIQKKYSYLVENSLLSDCYFYLGYINKVNMVAASHIIPKKPDLIHLLKIGMDLEHDGTKIERQINTIQELANKLVAHLSMVKNQSQVLF